MLRLEAGGGVQLACGSLSPPCRAKLSEVGSASWLASQSALPAAHIICARTWGGTTRSQYTVPRKLRPPLDMPIRALRQQAATYGSEWPRESGAHPWRVPTHSGFTRPRSGMKGPDWGLAGAGTTVKRPPFESLVFCPSHFRTVNVERSDAQAHSHKKGHIMEGSEERGPAPRAVGTCGSLRGCGRTSIGAARDNDPTLHNDGLSRLQPRQRARPRGGQRPAASHHAPLRKHAVPRLRPPPSRTRS